jgi:hypothetical protein
MPFDLGIFEQNVASTEVVYGRDKFMVRYHPSSYDDAFHKEFVARDSRGSVNYYLSQLLAGWDLTRDGQPIPIAPETIEPLPLPVKIAIVQAIEVDVKNPTTMARSRDMPARTPTSSNGGPPAAPSGATSGPSAYPIGSS